MYIEGKQTNQLGDDIWTSSASTSRGGGLTASAFEQESDSHSHSSASELRVKGRLHNYGLASSIGETEELPDSAFVSCQSPLYNTPWGLYSSRFNIVWVCTVSSRFNIEN